MMETHSWIALYTMGITDLGAIRHWTQHRYSFALQKKPKLIPAHHSTSLLSDRFSYYNLFTILYDFIEFINHFR